MMLTLSIISGFIIFVLWFRMFDDWLSKVFIKLSDKHEKLGANEAIFAGSELSKFNVDFALTHFDFSVLDLTDVSDEEKLALLNFHKACVEYRIYYLYVADKNTNDIFSFAVHPNFKNGKLFLK